MLLLAIAGYLVIGGGGGSALCDRPNPSAACEEYIDEFVRLAGGAKASLIIIPTAAFFDEAARGLVPRSANSSTRCLEAVSFFTTIRCSGSGRVALCLRAGRCANGSCCSL